MFPIKGVCALPLISETDFSVAEGTNDYYSVEMTDGFVNSKAIPHISVESIPLADGTESTETKSDFLDKPHYAITPNPIRLDNLRLEDNGGGLIFSAGKGTNKISEGTKILSYIVSGLKNGGEYEVVVEYCNPLSTTYLNTSGSNSAPHLTGSYHSMIQVGVNNTETSSGKKLVALSSKAGTCLAATIKSPTAEQLEQEDVRPITDNTLTVNVYISDMGDGEALMIRSIQVYAEPEFVPEAEDITIAPFCENDPNRATKLDEALAVIPSTYDITWYRDTVTPIKDSEPDVVGASASTMPYVSYFTVTDKKTKLVSKYYTFTFTVKETPSEILAVIDPFCEYINGAISSSADATVAPMLPASTKGYDVDWYNSPTVSSANMANTDLSTLPGSTTPYTYYYALSLNGCTSEPEEYDFIVRPLVKQNVIKDNECDKTTLTVSTEPSDATSIWNNGAEGKALIFTTEMEAVGNYSVVSYITGYCESEPKDIISDFYKTPEALEDYSVQYLKAEGKSTDGVFSTDKLIAGVAGKTDVNATIQWIGQMDSSTPPANTNNASDTPANPKADDVNDPNDETHYYFAYQQIAYSATVTCPSKFSTVEVKILGAPEPEVTPVSYCLNDTPDPITSFAATTTGGPTDTKTYSLVWFASEEDYPANPLPAAPTITTDNVGKTSYYVAQWDDANHNNISSLRHVDVTTYGVLQPSVQTPINFCFNENVSQLTADAATSTNEYYVSNGFLWGEVYPTTTAPTPNTVSVGTETYKVRATYTTTTLFCKSEPIEITVTVSKTDAPSPQTIQYTKADAIDGKTFPAINEAKEPWLEESGYTYYYSSMTDDANVAVSDYMEGIIPTPIYNTSLLNGESKELYYYIYRIDNSNSCPSDTVKITVKINDVLSPNVKDVYVCEGSTVPELEAEISIMEGAGKNESEYSLNWYGTEDPRDSNDPTPLNSVSQTTFSTGITSAVAVNNAKTTTQYYVTQKDNTTGAESDPSVINVVVLPKPVIMSKDVTVKYGEKVDLNECFEIVNSSEVGTTTPTYAKGSNIVENSGTYSFTVAYPVDYTRPQYTVDDDQCVSENSYISVVIEQQDSTDKGGPEPELQIPNYFSPNGDGVNDKWTIEALKDAYPKSQVQIYNQIGKLIIEYLGKDFDGWDGTYLGQPMPSTDYWYKIYIEEKRKYLLGHFTLIR
ncbi:MAG: T9SS type B sorting domain-containing protein [Paludibacteraceae bacterium]|nr:T9SS type B sorting domain-containing protein [Paludibacteraceae bacterium]